MKITAEHIALLRRMRFDFDDEMECAAVTSDPKRPFGNGDVPGDICEILGLAYDPDDDDCPVSWTDAQRTIAELSAIVQHIVTVHSNLDLVGVDVEYPWRAGRFLAANPGTS